ncbi:GntR family transcriptional regulator [Fulvimarina sp. 2208YS6-2-32]|uniref:GntR family transcriptional regulator n=1 Tax=Fulvimarina uroteuthidis TaxID=3098149 RepID=A0ABU5I0C2_9HYPH|nr:GntR family transcriptional regulator [Fulvimarina sp. 2208YS6-2-32]MDY8108841.1 GntR family transcriptional regulator [Fulvimarina sp. 2208YS6-2-32]
MQGSPHPSPSDTPPIRAEGARATTGASNGARRRPPSGVDRSVDQTATAYERIEELFVSMQLLPGSFVRTQDIQALVGLGRTPVHQAVRRLAAETLIEVRPRNGLMIAPIDLARERHLAFLRRDMIRFVTEAAMRNLSANERAYVHYLRRQLAEAGPAMTLDRFNEIDKSFDLLLIQASGERFLERALRPLHALARRTGYLHFTDRSADDGLKRSIALHLAIMDAVLSGDAERARTTCDDLVAYGIALIDDLGEGVDPHRLDVGYAPMARGDRRPSDEAPPGGA